MKKRQKPVIGILANIELIDRGALLGQERSSLNQNYIQSILKAGGIPVVLPLVKGKEEIRAQIDLVDGLIMSGGYDVQPLLYGEEPHPDLGAIYPERDHYEMEALSQAYQLNKPILGICRGLQLINVAFGGTLYQDLSHFHHSSKIKHAQEAQMHVIAHTVSIIPNSMIHTIFGKTELGTNSFHHQGIKRLADGFIASAHTKDNVIEAIEKKNYPFLVGVQWHPERMFESSPEMLHIFQALVKASQET